MINKFFIATFFYYYKVFFSLSLVIFESYFVLKSNKPFIVCFLIAIFGFCRKKQVNFNVFGTNNDLFKEGKQFFELRDLLFCFCIFSLPFEKTVWVVVSVYWMLWITKYTALPHSNKSKIVMTIFHR